MNKGEHGGGRATGRDSLVLRLEIDGDLIRGPRGNLTIDPEDTPLRDLLMLLARETQRRPLAEILERFGYHSRATYYKKLRRFREAGLSGLLADTPGPRHKWRRSEEVIARIVALRKANPDASCPEIAARLARDGVHVSVRSVERTVTEQGLARERNR